MVKFNNVLSAQASKTTGSTSRSLDSFWNLIFTNQVLLKLGERMEVREVDLTRMMQLVEECSKEGTREGEEEPDDEEGGVFGLGLLTVKRGIMPGWENVFCQNFLLLQISSVAKWKYIHLMHIISGTLWCGVDDIAESYKSLGAYWKVNNRLPFWKEYQDFYGFSIFEHFPGWQMLSSSRPLPGQSESFPFTLRPSKLQVRLLDSQTSFWVSFLYPTNDRTHSNLVICFFLSTMTILFQPIHKVTLCLRWAVL